MPKGKLFEDTFEQLVELGQSTASKTVKSVVQTLNPFDKDSSPLSSRAREGTDRVEGSKNKNHTPLDFEKLKNKLQNKEKVQADALRNRLFQIVRQGDEKMLMQKRQKELEKKRKAEYEKQQRENELKKKKQQQSNDVPQGKVRKSIFSHKKIADRSHAETKPATGKQ